jgi:hypothetical protein
LEQAVKPALEHQSSFELANPFRKWIGMAVGLTVLFIAWIPIVWFWGNITSRSIGGAIYFFGVFAAFTAFWIWNLNNLRRGVRDPEQNKVVLAGHHMTISLATKKDVTLSYANIKSVRARAMTTESGRVLRPIELRLRRPSLWAALTSLGVWTVTLDVYDPDRFMAEVTARTGVP